MSQGRIGIFLGLLGVILGQSAFSADLPQILRDNVLKNPAIVEAQSHEQIADSVLDQTKAAYYPVVGIAADQSILSTDDNSDPFMPRVDAKWTVYNFGKTDAAVKRDEVDARYYREKTNEAAQEWAFEVSGYYLEALKAKMLLAAARDNLALHNHIIDQLKIITQYDPGRRSELTQAESRQIAVQDSIASYERLLGLSLRRIARHVQPAVTASELNDPFTDLALNDLITRYPVNEEYIKKNPSYLAQLEELARKKAELEFAKKAYYPDIDVRAQANHKDVGMYLSMSVDVYNAAKQPAVMQKQHEINAANAKITRMSDEIKQRADMAVIQMQQDMARLQIADRHIMDLRQVVVDYEDQFKIGARTLLNVVDAYSELASAQQGKVNTQYDLMSAKLEYLSAVGALGDWAQLPTVNTASAPQTTSSDAEVFVGDKNILKTEETKPAEESAPKSQSEKIDIHPDVRIQTVNEHTEIRVREQNALKTSEKQSENQSVKIEKVAKTDGAVQTPQNAAPPQNHQQNHEEKERVSVEEAFWQQFVPQESEQESKTESPNDIWQHFPPPEMQGGYTLPEKP